MGVHGLWKLLEPAGKPVPLENLENKVLAVDVSIWLYQLTKGFQTTGGGIVPNAHILGLFNRICKLMYYRIKPVFVFDGGVPLLKKETIEARKRQKLKAQDISERLRERLLDNLLKQKAVRNLLGNDDVPSSCKNNENDMFALPPMPEPEEDEIEDSEEEENTEMNTAKVDSLCNYHIGKDLHSIDISSEQFKSLPPEIRHDILSELQETRKQNSWARIHEMPDESTDFSKYQMERLVKRRNVQRSLDSAAKEMGGRMMTIGELEELLHDQGVATDSLPGRRIAADNVTRYVYLTGGKGDKGEAAGTKNGKSEQTDSNAEVPSSPNETEIEKQLPVTPEKPIKSEIDESEFRENVYAIDQCVFAVSSSSDEELEKCEDFGRDYAKQLSMEEKMSQEEILRLIKQQNSAAKKEYPGVPSTSSMSHRPYSDHSDVEDDPDPVAVPSTSGWSFSHSRRLSPETSAPVAPGSVSEENLAKSMTKLDKLLNSVMGRESEDAAEVKSQTETNIETGSVKSVSDSDSESGFVEVIEETPKSQYFDERKSQTIEISIDPSKIEEDLFADVFEPVVEQQDPEILDTERLKGLPAALPRSEEQFRESPEIFGDESVFNSVGALAEQISTETVEVLEHSELERDNPSPLKSNKSSPVKDAEPRKETQPSPKPSEESVPNKSVTDAKTKERVRKIAEIFNRVRKTNENRNKVNKPTEDNEPVEAQDEKLTEVERELNNEHDELLAERGKQDRLGSTITQQMIVEAQELLQLFGLPYIIAPMEAEAQCAFLDKISLTEGTITDDSDIWLFGGQKVYKNFFDNRKYVLQFRNVDIEHFFRLTREQLIQMALLVGSDYTVGIEGVGPVTALEILAYFSDKSNKPETEADIAETLRSFKRWIQVNRGGPSALGKKMRNVRLSEGFPNEAVIDAYLFPTVNESNEGFTWAPPDLDRIREYMKTKFGWKTTRIDEILLPVMKRQTERNYITMQGLKVRFFHECFLLNKPKASEAIARVEKPHRNPCIRQTTLDKFFQARPYYSVDATNMSKRVVEAISIMRNKVDVDVSQLPTKSPRKSRKSGTAKASSPRRPRRGAAASGPAPARRSIFPSSSAPSSSGGTAVASSGSGGGREVIPQREKDRLEAAKRKLEAVRILRAKGGGRGRGAPPKKRKVLPAKRDSSYLSESSSGSDDD